MSDISERIQARMRALNLKSVNLVKHTGASKASVSQWVNGASKPRGENLLALSRLLECTPDWLLTGKDPKKPDSELIGGFNFSDEEDREEVDLPFFREVEIPASKGKFHVIESRDEKLRFSKSTLNKLNIDKESAVCAKVNGNSMEPVLPSGSIVCVDKSKVEVLDGAMYAIDHNGMLRVKMLYRTPGGGIRLKSFNSEEHPDETYGYEEVKEISVLGRLFWYSAIILN